MLWWFPSLKSVKMSLHILHLWSIGKKGFLTDFEKMVYWLNYRPKGPEVADFCYFWHHNYQVTSRGHPGVWMANSCRTYYPPPIVHLTFGQRPVALLWCPRWVDAFLRYCYLFYVCFMYVTTSENYKIVMLSYMEKLGEITGKTRVVYSELAGTTGKTRILPCGIMFLYESVSK